MRLTLEMTGTTPLLMHNVRLADPEDEIVKQIKALTDKKKNKTEDDRREIERLEWYGGLYTNGDHAPSIPTSNIKKCLNRAAVVTRNGTDVARAVHFSDLYVPLVYEGPKTADALWKSGGFKDRKVVGIGRSRTVRVRPCFRSWAIVADLELIENLLDPDRFENIVRTAGVIEGLGDNRINGYGRFEGNVKKN